MIDRFVLLIGAMKAGTTALWSWLAQHPEIAACRTKEPNTLCDRERWERFEEYQALWDWDPARHRWALEASTNYSKLPVRSNAVLAAQRLPAEFRFLYMVRNPAQRLRSQYLHSLAEGWIERPIFEGITPAALMFCNYRFQLEPYRTFHGRESCLVLSYESFRADARATVRRVCTFLGIDPDFPFCDPGPQNSSELYRRKLLERILKERGLPPALHSLDAVAAAAAEIERWITPSPEQVERLHTVLGPDLALFEAEWGVDPWGGVPAPLPYRRASALLPSR